MTDTPQVVPPADPTTTEDHAEPQGGLALVEHILRRHNPAHHTPALVVSADHRGESVLDRVADVVSRIVGSMWTFVACSAFIVTWLLIGSRIGDSPPWPLLLVIINLPQLSIMISLQVSANLAQKTSDARAVAAYDTVVALHRINVVQLEILRSQQAMLQKLSGVPVTPVPAAPAT